MGLFTDAAREDESNFFCRKIADKMEKYKDNPQAVAVLKELGREVLDSLPAIPKWSHEFSSLFRAQPNDLKK